jgi:hypothetical protein
MAERLQLSWACFAVLGAVGLTSRASFGAPNDAAALKVRDDAIYTDYLATNFASAASKLQRGLALCKAAGDCGPAVRGRLLCDLGVMDFLLRKPDEGRAQFAAALREDPTLTLDNDLSSVEVQREFAATQAGGSASAPPAAEHTSIAKGDMAHTPPTSQAFLTPIPIYVELPDGITAAKVYVRYKPFGVTEWKTAHMTAVGNGYGTEIPCGDVGDSRGEIFWRRAVVWSNRTA